MDALISFSRDREQYKDSGEGGLFAMLFVVEPTDWTDNCYRDVFVRATRPDVMTHQTSGEDPWRPWSEELSDSFLASVLLGSTCHSLYSEERGHYWQATYEDLTTLGKMIYNSLKVAYGVEPVICTFLDT